MEKKTSIFNKQQIQKVFSLVLSFLLIFPHILVIAEAQELLNEDKDEAITVTIEDHTTGEFILEPTRVESNEGKYVENILKNTSDDIEVETFFDASWNTSVKSVTSSDGRVIEEDNSNNWTVFLESKDAGDLLFAYASPNETIRLIYSSKDEDQLGVDGDTLKVNKDALVAALGRVGNMETPPDELKDLHTKGLELLLNSDTTATEVEESTKELNEILNKIIPAERLNITPKNAEVNIGEATELTAEVMPENATGEVKWTSLSPEIATVDANGKVTGHQAGEVEIQAEIDGLKEKVKVSVKDILAKSIKFVDEELTIAQGSSEKLEVIVEPENRTEDIVFTSDDEEIAEVNSSGVLVGKQPGETKVHVQVGDLKDSLSVKVEERGDYTEPTVVFEFADGRVIHANNQNEFVLSPMDIGKFVLKGAEDIDFVDGSPYWDAAQKVMEGNVTKTNVWIAANGAYQPYAPQTVSAKVFTSSPYTGDNTLIEEFKIKTIPTDIMELKGFVDGEEVKQDALFGLAGSESKDIEMQGRIKGTNDFIEIPRQALTYKEVGQGNGYINGGSFGMNTLYDLPEGAQTDFEIALVDGNASFSFTAYSEKVNVDSFEVKTPKIVYIDKWNNLAGQYVGFLPEVSINPENATNSHLNWEAITPDIAEYVPQHNNGIVPKKAGNAEFLVTSEDNPALTQEVALEFKYKNPLVLADISEDELVLEQYTDMEIPLKIAPKNATEQRFNWSFSKEGIVEVDQKVYQENTSNVNSAVVTSHTLVAQEVGTVTVTGTPVDDTEGAKKVQFKVTVTPSMTEENTEYLDLAIENKKHGLDYLKKSSLTSYGDEWNVFTLLRSGEEVSQKVRNDYANSVIKTLNSQSRLVPTDYARMILALEAAGYDAKDIDGHNLVETLYMNKNLENYPANHVMWTLIGLDTKAYAIPENAEWSREKLIQNILKYQSADGSFSLNKEEAVGSVDMTAMGIQALAPYYENSLRKNVADQIPASLKDEVNEAVEKAVNYLSQVMTFDAGFIAEGMKNSNSAAQVLTALSSIQLNVLEHQGFVKGNKNILTNIEKFKVDGGYAHFENQKVNEMATVQVTYGLEAFERFITGEKSLYDFTDVVEENEMPDDSNQEEDIEIEDEENNNKPTETPGQNNNTNQTEKPDHSDQASGSDILDNKDQNQTADDKQIKESEQASLPKTGERESNVLISLVLITSGSVLLTFKKRKKKVS